MRIELALKEYIFLVLGALLWRDFVVKAEAEFLSPSEIVFYLSKKIIWSIDKFPYENQTCF